MPSGGQVEGPEGGITRKTRILLKAGHVQAAVDLRAREADRNSEEPQAMEHAKSLGWLDNEGNWRVLKWNAVQQHLEVDATVKWPPLANLLGQVVQVRKAINETSLLRFKSVRRLSPAVQTEWVTFQIFISLRPQGSPERDP